MGRTGFCKNLRVSAVPCENLRFPVVFCENLHLRNAVVPRKSENLRKPAKMCQKLRIWLCLSLLVCPLHFREDQESQNQHGVNVDTVKSMTRPTMQRRVRGHAMRSVHTPKVALGSPFVSIPFPEPFWEPFNHGPRNYYVNRIRMGIIHVLVRMRPFCWQF